jgi:hypothetical protein
MYRILRDNKEKGPLSLEELIGLSLKPYDLIWVEGRSAGWRYPSEIEALKPYLASSGPDSPSAAAAQIHPASQNLRSPSVNVIAPPGPQTVATKNATVEDEGVEEMTAEKLEKKAAELYQRVQAYTQQNQEQQQDVQTKYARSLDDLKQEYADWLHKKKERKKFKPGKKGMIALGSVLGIGALSLVFILYKNKKTVSPEPQQNYVSSAAYAPAIPLKKSIVARSEKKSVDLSRNNVRQGLSVDAFIDSVERVMARGNRGSIPYPKLKKDKNPENIQKPAFPSQKGPAPAMVKTEEPISSLVNMNARYMQDPNKHNISSLEVTIQNNSAAFLKMVTVEVFYYKRGERLFDRETLYFNNIQPGNSLTLSTPGNKKAVTARFQLGQINGQN